MSSSQLNVQASAVRVVRKIDEIVACRAPLPCNKATTSSVQSDRPRCIELYQLSAFFFSSYVLHLLPVANAESQC